jgi:RNA polymerase sigma-70 factor (ECF subfamily)
MKYFEDMKYEDIAAVTGGSVGGLKANYFHATQKIEQYLLSKLNH